MGQIQQAGHCTSLSMVHNSLQQRVPVARPQPLLYKSTLHKLQPQVRCTLRDTTVVTHQTGCRRWCSPRPSPCASSSAVPPSWPAFRCHQAGKKAGVQAAKRAAHFTRCTAAGTRNRCAAATKLANPAHPAPTSLAALRRLYSSSSLLLPLLHGRERGRSGRVGPSRSGTTQQLRQHATADRCRCFCC